MQRGAGVAVEQHVVDEEKVVQTGVEELGLLHDDTCESQTHEETDHKRSEVMPGSHLQH